MGKVGAVPINYIIPASTTSYRNIMRIPIATYRLQFNAQFDLKSAAGIISYLSDLNITDIYASPIFKARKGSPHGYDIVDPNQLNPELGSPEEFKLLFFRRRCQKSLIGKTL